MIYDWNVYQTLFRRRRQELPEHRSEPYHLCGPNNIPIPSLSERVISLSMRAGTIRLRQDFGVLWRTLFSARIPRSEV